MKEILILGAGRSSTDLIDYLLQRAEKNNWLIVVTDRDEELARKRVGDKPGGRAKCLDISDVEARKQAIKNADLIVSMLPANMHVEVIKDAIAFKKNVLTPSYITPEMEALDEDAKNAGILVLNEMGLDPGIDHMSAMRVLDQIREDGGEMVIFETFAGGLLAPGSDTNPWQYKFTWNPRNVVLAGSGGAVKFKQNNMYKYIPYHRLFRRTEFIDIPGYGRFEGYANRDSLKYRSVYKLDNIPTIYRGTLRRPGFCRGWDVFVQLGMTDDSYIMEGSEKMTHRQFLNSFLAYSPVDSVELKLKYYLKIDQDSNLIEKFEWLGLFDDTPIGLKNATPAQILQHILEKKWTLEADDRDMIVMWHKFGFRLNGKDKELNSSMVVLGKDTNHTAMSMTVGWPLAIAAELMLNDSFSAKGMVRPVTPEIYNPVLNELEKLGVVFNEYEVSPRFY